MNHVLKFWCYANNLSDIYFIVQVNLKDKGLKVFGGGLPGIYTVEQFHFHWGSEDSRGSEHEINGQHFAMEVNITSTDGSIK